MYFEEKGRSSLQPKVRLSIVFMVLCSAMWSTAGILIKLVPWNPLVITGFRGLIAASVVAVYMAVSRTPLRINRTSLLAGLVLFATSFCFVTANKLTTSANAIVLQFTAPVFIMLLSFLFLGQRFHRRDYVVVVATMAGIALCFFDQLSAGSLVGNGIAVLSGLFMAGMFVTTGHAEGATRMSGIFLGQLATAVVGIPLALVFPTPVSGAAIASIVALGVFQLGIPYVLYGLAAGHCPPLLLCLISAVEPLLNPVWVFLFDGEMPGLFSLIGGVVVIGSVTVWCVWNEKKQVQPA